MKNKKISDSLVCSCTWNSLKRLFSVWIWIFHVIKVSAFDPPSPIWPTTVLERSTEPEYSLRSATSWFFIFLFPDTKKKKQVLWIFFVSFHLKDHSGPESSCPARPADSNFFYSEQLFSEKNTKLTSHILGGQDNCKVSGRLVEWFGRGGYETENIYFYIASGRGDLEHFAI